MDKLSVISFTLFFIADCFAVAALCMPDWIVSNVGGKKSFSFYEMSIFHYFISAPVSKDVNVLVLQILSSLPFYSP